MSLAERREFISSLSNIDNIVSSFADSENLENVHTENLVGAASVPLGVVGPIDYKDKGIYAPLATSEGVLIASVSRGIKLINSAIELKVNVERVGITRAPVFEFKSQDAATDFIKHIDLKNEVYSSAIKKVSSRTKVLKWGCQQLENLVYVRIYFDTQDAMGMNMATIASEAISEVICSEYGCELLAISSNYCSDKKPSADVLENGRGFRVTAEAEVEPEVVKSILKVDVNRLVKIWRVKCVTGSELAGSLGKNCHFANVVAAFYIATGQDPAHVVEGSLGEFELAETENGNLKIKVNMPAVLLGTVGGGTKLTTARESLSMMGVKSSSELAEVLGTLVLAGEVSLLASIAEGSLGGAHNRLGR